MEILKQIHEIATKIHSNHLKRLQLEETLLMELVFETKDLTLRSKALERKKEIDMITYKMLGK